MDSGGQWEDRAPSKRTGERAESSLMGLRTTLAAADIFFPLNGVTARSPLLPLRDKRKRKQGEIFCPLFRQEGSFSSIKAHPCNRTFPAYLGRQGIAAKWKDSTMPHLLAARNRSMRKKMEQQRSTPLPEEGGLICSEESDWNVRIPFSQNDTFFPSSRRKREEERNGADRDG